MALPGSSEKKIPDWYWNTFSHWSPNLSALLGASFPLIRLASLLADPLLRRCSFAANAKVRIDLIHRVVEGNSNLGGWVNSDPKCYDRRYVSCVYIYICIYIYMYISIHICIYIYIDVCIMYVYDVYVWYIILYRQYTQFPSAFILFHLRYTARLSISHHIPCPVAPGGIFLRFFSLRLHWKCIGKAWENISQLEWWHSQYMEKLKMFQTTNQKCIGKAIGNHGNSTIHHLALLSASIELPARNSGYLELEAIKIMCHPMVCSWPIGSNSPRWWLQPRSSPR